MPSERTPVDPARFDVSESDIDVAISACDGDARAAVRALLVAYAMLEHEVSRGFGRHAPGARAKAKT